MKYLIIANKISGQGSSDNNLKEVTSTLDELNLEYSYKLTEYQCHATEIAASVSENDNTTIISLGGDGTIFEIINGIKENVPLIIVPSGSSNDFFRIISGNKKRKIKDIVRDSINGKTTKIDLVKATRDGITYKYLNTTSVGLDADINSLAVAYNRSGKHKKENSYAFAIADSITHINSKDLIISYNGKTESIRTFLLTAMNGRYYGNGFNPTPKADLQDGLLDCVYVKPMSLLKTLYSLFLYLKGKTDKVKGATLFRTDKIEITADKPFNLQSDGENFECQKLTIEVLPKSLTITIPEYTYNFK